MAEYLELPSADEPSARDQLNAKPPSLARTGKGYGTQYEASHLAVDVVTSSVDPLVSAVQLPVSLGQNPDSQFYFGQFQHLVQSRDHESIAAAYLSAARQALSAECKPEWPN